MYQAAPKSGATSTCRRALTRSTVPTVLNSQTSTTAPAQEARRAHELGRAEHSQPSPSTHDLSARGVVTMTHSELRIAELQYFRALFSRG
jgi:hypothetical protein